MTATIVNGAPMSIMLGVNDKSTRALIPEPEALPTHLPKFYTFAKKGPLNPQLVSGSSLIGMYHEDSFDLRKKYATHATVYMNAINAQGNAMMVQRVVPDDAPPPANIRIMADVLATKLPVYLRNADGSIKTDANGQKIKDADKTVDGYQLKWVVSAIPATEFGQATQVAGDQVDATGNVQSTRYPFIDLEVAHVGEYGNNIGFRLWAPNANSTQPIDARLIGSRACYPYRMSCVSRKDASSTPSTVETQSAEQFLNVVLKPNVIDPNTDALMYAGDVFVQAYQEFQNVALPPQWGPFGQMNLYEDDIKALHEMFYNAEKPFIDSFSDFDGSGVEEAYRFNLVSGLSSSAVPYHSFALVSGTANSVRFTENTTVYATGGGDGTLNEASFAQLVAKEVAEYGNLNSVLQDSAKYPESIIYDSGFPLETKYALTSFIAIRKDTAVVLSTHDVNGPKLSASQESALAVALKTRLQMYPESEYFGTSTMRGMVVGRSGTLLNSQYRKPLPLSLELAVKSAKYMGASNGRWKSGFGFDSAPNNVVTLFTDVNVQFTPAAVRNKDWSNGLVWVESYQRRSLYFPAFKTVYDNDTSVLNSYFTMMCCVELQKVAERVRRMFSGESFLTNAQLAQRINEETLNQCTGRFDNRYVIQSDCYFTKADEARGYSYTHVLKLFSPTMKTVGTISIETYRIEDLAAA